MLPLSPGRAALSTARAELRDSLAWLRPANIASTSSAELRALAAWLAVFVASAVLIALGYVWLRLKVVDVGYRLSATRQVIQRLQQEGHELTVEASTLDAPERLEQVARARLGMTRPETGEAVLP